MSFAVETTQFQPVYLESVWGTSVTTIWVKLMPRLTPVGGHPTQNQLNKGARCLLALGTCPRIAAGTSRQESASGVGCGVGSPEALGTSANLQKSPPEGNGNTEKPRALRMAKVDP